MHGRHEFDDQIESNSINCFSMALMFFTGHSLDMAGRWLDTHWCSGGLKALQASLRRGLRRRVLKMMRFYTQLARLKWTPAWTRAQFSLFLLGHFWLPFWSNFGTLLGDMQSRVSVEWLSHLCDMSHKGHTNVTQMSHKCHTQMSHKCFQNRFQNGTPKMTFSETADLAKV